MIYRFTFFFIVGGHGAAGGKGEVEGGPGGAGSGMRLKSSGLTPFRLEDVVGSLLTYYFAQPHASVSGGNGGRGGDGGQKGGAGGPGSNIDIEF
jgi:hypothetical protein